MAPQTPIQWRSRIVRHGEVDPKTIQAHPDNPKTHPTEQLTALEGVLEEIGWVTGAIISQRSGRWLDGHARAEKAIERGQAVIPATWVDVTEAEERMILATFDPIGSLAKTDEAKMRELIETAETDNQKVVQFLATVKPVTVTPPEIKEDEVPEPPAEPVARRGDIWILGGYTVCPDCGHHNPVQ